MRIILVFALPVLLPLSAPADEGDDELARKLAAVVRDPKQQVSARVEAARMIGLMGPRAPAAVPDLIRVLERLQGAELEPVQEAIISALGQIGAPAKQALPTMARAAARSVDIEQAARRSTALILAASDSQDVDALMRQLQDRDSSFRLRAVKALGNLGPAAKIAVPNLLTALQDTDADVRRAAVNALRMIVPDAPPSTAIVKAIAVDLQDPDPLVRAATARALGRMGRAAISAAIQLEMLLSDPDPDVRKAASDALSRITGNP
jgi:HEAT repeat protein